MGGGKGFERSVFLYACKLFILFNYLCMNLHTCVFKTTWMLFYVVSQGAQCIVQGFFLPLEIISIPLFSWERFQI